MTDDHASTGRMGWGRFAAMILTSSVLMFVLMYQLVYRFEDATFSINRLTASLVMACVMTAVMLGFMWSMYAGRALKWTILTAAVLGAVLLLVVNRQQLLVADAAFLRAMIPHHSIAINNARRADLSDPRIRALADGIIRSQLVEIRAMQLLLDDLARNGERATTPLPPRPDDLTPDMAAEAARMAE